MSIVRSLALVLAWCASMNAAGEEVTKLRPSQQLRPAQLLLYDFHYATPFAVRVGFYAASPKCRARPGGRIIGIEVVDAAEAPDRATYCVSIDGYPQKISLSEVEDRESEVGRAVIVSISYYSGVDPRVLKVRATPWAASIEP